MGKIFNRKFLFIEILIVLFFITVCSIYKLKNKTTYDTHDSFKESADIKEEVQTDEDPVKDELQVDKQAVVDAYEKSKKDLGAYFYIWDSPKYKIPLLLITDSCVDEDWGFHYPGNAFECSVYYADPADNYGINKIGELYASSTTYPLAEDDEGLYVAFHHFVYQYIPDYESKELIVWNGFEDNIVNEIKEHNGYLEITNGNIKEVDSVDTSAAYEVYGSANRIVFSNTIDKVSDNNSQKTDVYDLDEDDYLEEEGFDTLAEAKKYIDDYIKWKKNKET